MVQKGTESQLDYIYVDISAFISKHISKVVQVTFIKLFMQNGGHCTILLM